ncbi:MAG: hypothetical protein J5965_26155 [Aeriscardovia sp.]|nr:hypothetical protein [Aeriscardovia sp.]
MSLKGQQQSDRLTNQQKATDGVIGIFDENAQKHDKEVYNTSTQTMEILKKEFPKLKFRYRRELSKQEINEHLKKIDTRLGQTLFCANAKIKPDGGIIEVLDDNNNWRVVVVSEAKYQGKDIENIKKGKLVGKNNDQVLMAAGNAIERAHKNICEIANFMLTETYFPYILFLEGSNFLTQNITVTRPDGSTYTISYDDGTLNRLDRLTAANYGMPINTNLCENRFVAGNGLNIMLQAASIYTQGDGNHWNEKDMIEIMLDIARTSLRMIGKDVFKQLTKK